MRKECVAMLLAGGQGSRLGNLTRDVAKPAVTFGGKYRIIDFALSNCSYSKIDTIGVLTQYKPLALISYIGNGRSWAMESYYGSVSILPPYVSRKGGMWYKGTADAIYQNIEYLNHYNPENVLIISGDQIYKMDYSKMIDFHKKLEADVTISVIDVPWSDANRFGIMNIDENNKINEFEEKPEKPKSNKASMGIYVFKWEVLKNALISDHKDNNSHNDFGKNIIPQLLDSKKKIVAYPYKGYWKDVGTIESYYEANMELFDSNAELNLNDFDFKIYSNNPNLQSHYLSSSAKVQNSLICDGCTIYGEIYKSIISTNVVIKENSIIKNSIILQDVVIEENVNINKAIIGEGVHISRGSQIGDPDGKGEIQVVCEDK